MEKIQIIENTEKKKEKFEKNYWGTGTYYLTKKHLKALSEGKCLATDINNEYAIFIELG